MNRLATSDVGALRPGQLPPQRREGPARVLFVHSMFAGLTTYARELAAYTDGRSDVDASHVFVRWPLWAKLAGKALPQSRLPGWDLHAWRKMRALRRVLNSWLAGPLDARRFDTISIMTQGIGLSAVDIQRRWGCRVVINLDATGENEVRHWGYARWTRAAFIRDERRIYAAADLICPWTRWVERSLVEHYAIAPEKILVAPGAVPISESFPATTHAHGGSGASAGERLPRLAFVGNDWARKGGARLLAWHQQRWADRAELHVFSGRVAPDPSARNVVWHGAVAREELLSRHLPGMDLFVLPTREDTFVWAALEASGVGLPIVASRVAGLPEVVREGETGILCPWNDDAAFIGAIERLLGDAALRRSMGQAGRQHVRERFNPAACFGPMIDRIVALPARGDGPA